MSATQASSAGSAEARLLSFIRRRQFFIFFFLVFLISWLPWIIGGDWEIWAVSLVGVLMVALTAGKEGLLDLGRRTIKWRVDIRLWLIVLFLPAMIAIVALGIYALIGGQIPNLTFLRDEWVLLPLFFLAMIFPAILGGRNAGPLAEEFGWRGYAQPAMQRPYGALRAALVIGFFWGIWHLPQFYTPGSTQAALGGLLMLFPFTIGEISNSVIMAWLHNKTGGSLLLAGILWHAFISAWSVLLILGTSPSMLIGNEPTAPTSSTLIWIHNGVLALTALLFVVRSSGQLGQEGS